ncbi:MAG: hypothetical protein FWB71_03110 [Defluviitaleaceae bacterium]|nr:hypothetical protein [Defluviitaleaceae bacterium]
MKKKIISVVMAVALAFAISLPIATYAETYFEPPALSCCVPGYEIDGQGISPFGWTGCCGHCSCEENWQCFCPPVDIRPPVCVCWFVCRPGYCGCGRC